MTTDTMEVKLGMDKTQEPKGKTIVAVPVIQATTVLTTDTTVTGAPALWERGGGLTNTGSATVIAGPDGAPKIPEYVRGRGSLANSHHARFAVAVGDIVVEADHHRQDFDIRVWRIDAIGQDGAQARLAHRFVMGKWDAVPGACVMNAVRAAEEKALCYHCREPHYAEYVPAADRRREV